ncbi:MAG: hypothetical protein HGA38_01075 [Candidatus Moranbacteria bacterium]|nr:hypothetical protein [Candidatus Moranbacteria bacterium]
MKGYRLQFFAVVIVALIFVLLFPCSKSIERCMGGDSIPAARTLFHSLLSVIVVFPFLFIFSDALFRKWSIFSGIWFPATWLLVLVTPAYRHGFFSMDPTKEQVSLWMSVAFVVISFGMFAWEAKPWKRLR